MPVDIAEFEEWVKTAELPPLIDEEDVKKEAEITDIAWADTRYGRRLRVSVKFDDGTVKNALLSKMYAKALAKEFGLDLNSWIGKKVLVEKVLTPRGIMKPTIVPLRE